MPSTARNRSSPDPETSPPHVNEVRLIGRLAVEPMHRDLPSGDVLVSFRLVVDRGASRTAGRSVQRNAGVVRTPTVDALECTAWRKDVQRSLARMVAGDVLEVQGALRRRFWRTGGGGPASRSEVEVTKARRVSAAT